MRDFRVVFAASGALFLIGCGTAPEIPVESDPDSDLILATIMKTDTCPSSSIETTSMDEQMPMMDRCNALHQSLRDIDVIAHGGVRPGVNDDVWTNLPEFSKAKVLLSAACQQSAGLPGPQAVTVVEAGRKMSSQAKPSACAILFKHQVRRIFPKVGRDEKP